MTGVTYTVVGIDAHNLDPGAKIIVKVASVQLRAKNDLQVKLQVLPEKEKDFEAELRAAIAGGERDDLFDWLKGMCMSNLVIADKLGALFDELCKTNRTLINMDDGIRNTIGAMLK
jgi:hypothetical protein